MSRISKCKLEKTKVKVVFRLQFHATHVPQNGWDKLFISFIPADSGKTTAKTTKANVRNGTCKWADPIYETTRLLQDSKSKQYDEKLYKLVVAMGSSRASILGEAAINLADYADASKPSAIALPLHGCNFETILHVTVQLLTSKTGFREFELQREHRERGLQSGVDGQHVDGGTGKISYAEETASEQIYKANSRVRFRPDAKDVSSLEEDVSLNDADSAIGLDGSSNTSESLYAEKHETSSSHEIDSLKSTTSGDFHGLSTSQSPLTEKGDLSEHRTMHQQISDSVHEWGSDCNVDTGLAIARAENNRLRGSLEVAESSIFDLNLEVSTLQSLADELGTETQKLSHLLATEISSSAELRKEVSVMKAECLEFEGSLAKLKDLKFGVQNAVQASGHSQGNQLPQDVPLRWVEGISVLEDRLREIQNKISIGFFDSGALYSELEVLFNMLRSIRHGSGEAVSLLNMVLVGTTDVKEVEETYLNKTEQSLSATGLGLDLSLPESILPKFSLTPPVSQVSNPAGAIDAMKGQIFDLIRELDEAKVEREGLVRKMDQMECYYEALIQELEENQKRMLGELQNLRNEHSAFLYTISADRSEIESMRQEMNKQILRFADERRDLDALNKELEKRAATSEASLKRARLNYSIAVGKLQKDLQLLSSQVGSMFETNENLIRQAFMEPSKPQLQGQQEILLNQEHADATKSFEYQNQNVAIMKQPAGGDVLLEDLKRSLSLQKELYQKVEDELREMYSVNIQLDIYSKTLQETLLEANADFKTVKGRIDELEEELELSNAAQNQLMVRLQKAMEDIYTLNEYKSNCISQCSEMSLHNQILEDKLENISKENCLLAQKLTDCEAIATAHKIYQSKFETSLAENQELSAALKHELLGKGKFQHEVSTLEEKLRISKAELDESASLNQSLQEEINFLQDKLAALLGSYNKNFDGVAIFHESHDPDFKVTGLKSSFMQLEEIQQTACGKILQLMQEQKKLESERDTAEVSLSTARSEILQLKQKFKCDMEDMVAKLNLSNSLVDNLQYQLESVGKKFDRGSVIEAKYAFQSSKLLADLAILEDQLQELTSKNDHLAQEILGLDAVVEEFDKNKLTIAELTREKQELTMSLENKTRECIEFASEIRCLKESLKIFHDELDGEKGSKDELQEKIRDLTCKLNKELDKVIDFERQKSLMDKLQVQLESIGKKLDLSSEIEEKHAVQNSELLADLVLLEDQLQELTSKNDHLAQEILGLDAMVEELNKSKLTIDKLMQEKQELTMSLQNKTWESIELASEILCLKENLRKFHDKLYSEKGFKSELEEKIRDLTCRLNKELLKVDDFERQKSEIMHLRQMVSDLEFEKSKLAHVLEQQSESMEKLRKDFSCQAALESQLLEMLEYKVAAEVNFTYITSQCKTSLEVLVHKLASSDECLRELQQRYDDKEAKLTCCLASEARLYEENDTLLSSLTTMRTDLEDSIAQNRVLSDSHDHMKDQIEEYKRKLTVAGPILSEDKNVPVSDIEHLKNMLADAEAEISCLILSKEESEILLIVAKCKLDEQHAYVASLEDYKDELMMLQSQYNELSRKLTDQVLKTEEFKNLSIHLKELKDKAEAECLLAREKREPEGTPVAMNDSLRIAFMKEQYETKLQELKQQLSISKKHGEELLFKFQDSINEIETRKKSEAVNLKRNEELSLKLLELEAELQSVITEKREKFKDYDRIKAELECALLSLECCKDEKAKLEAFLKESEDEKSRLAAKLSSIQEQAKNLRYCVDIQKEENNGMTEVEHVKNESTKSFSPNFFGHDMLARVNSRDGMSCLAAQNDDLIKPIEFPPFKDAVSGGTHKIPEEVGGDSTARNGENLHVRDCSGAQSLKSSIEHLHEELEKLKNDNTLFAGNNDFYSDFQVSEREFVQLHKANEELRNMFPLFDEIPNSGNALERVLALEIELAEALKAKNKSSIHFQSSFMKQHSDEEAVYKSFKDINELIEELLELKRQHAAMEAELREMHDRYSQLSLQFAEVEGERQKLKITLKNVRTPKKQFITLNRSPSTSIVDHPS